LCSRQLFFTDDVWKSVLKPELGDSLDEILHISPEFVFIICTTATFVPPELMSLMHVIKVEDKPAATEATGDKEIDPMDQIAALYGASEIVRNSTKLVEAGFDGDLDELKEWIDKGYHIESTDGRKHTALSEAACQGHLHIVSFLLESGSDPNSVNDTGE
jgi:hypothetical protein